MLKYYVGTAGWSYKDWVPVFYPKNQTAGFDWLQFYSRYFNCVEVNSTYYSYISPKVVDGWIRKTADSEDFIFTVKLHQDFTHKKSLTKENIDKVAVNLNLLTDAERLGGLLIQFPYPFSFNGSSAEYVRRLKEIFQTYSCFVEVRHASWRRKEAVEFMKSIDVTLCAIDQPQIGEAIDFEPIVTNDKGYVRFHGRNVEAWLKSINNFGKKQTYEEQSGRYRYLYSPGELVEIQQKIKSIQNKVHEIFVIMNNYPRGDAVANAFELLHLLEEKTGVDIPNTILRAFPRMERIAGC